MRRPLTIAFVGLLLGATAACGRSDHAASSPAPAVSATSASAQQQGSSVPPDTATASETLGGASVSAATDPPHGIIVQTCPDNGATGTTALTGYDENGPTTSTVTYPMPQETGATFTCLPILQRNNIIGGEAVRSTYSQDFSKLAGVAFSADKSTSQAGFVGVGTGVFEPAYPAQSGFTSATHDSGGAWLVQNGTEREVFVDADGQVREATGPSDQPSPVADSPRGLQKAPGQFISTAGGVVTTDPRELFYRPGLGVFTSAFDSTCTLHVASQPRTPGNDNPPPGVVPSPGLQSCNPASWIDATHLLVSAQDAPYIYLITFNNQHTSATSKPVLPQSERGNYGAIASRCPASAGQFAFISRQGDTYTLFRSSTTGGDPVRVSTVGKDAQVVGYTC